MERYGYIRVSAKDQNPERQFRAMQEQQIEKEKNIWIKCRARTSQDRSMLNY